MTGTEVAAAVRWVRDLAPGGFRPEVALVLGSGLSGLAQAARAVTDIPYREIPGFAAPSVAGHRGELILGELSGRRVLVFSGRSHYYEGHPMDRLALPARVAAGLGARRLILTAAVGAIRPGLRVGDLVVLKDHLNFMGHNPLRGGHDPAWGERFPDMSAVYDAGLRKIALAAAKKRKIRAALGTYFAVSGPSYETPAEIRAFRKLGGDVVGMSVVPEALAARQQGLEVLGLCHVANAAAGVGRGALSHAEVLAAGKASGEKMAGLIAEILRRL